MMSTWMTTFIQGRFPSLLFALEAMNSLTERETKVSPEIVF